MDESPDESLNPSGRPAATQTPQATSIVFAEGELQGFGMASHQAANEESFPQVYQRVSNGESDLQVGTSAGPSAIQDTQWPGAEYGAGIESQRTTTDNEIQHESHLCAPVVGPDTSPATISQRIIQDGSANMRDNGEENAAPERKRRTAKAPLERPPSIAGHGENGSQHPRPQRENPTDGKAAYPQSLPKPLAVPIIQAAGGPMLASVVMVVGEAVVLKGTQKAKNFRCSR